MLAVEDSRQRFDSIYKIATIHSAWASQLKMNRPKQLVIPEASNTEELNLTPTSVKNSEIISDHAKT